MTHDDAKIETAYRMGLAGRADMTRCGCMRYPAKSCPAVTTMLLCPDCRGARCVVVAFPEGEEHVCADELEILQ